MGIMKLTLQKSKKIKKKALFLPTPPPSPLFKMFIIGEYFNKLG